MYHPTEKAYVRGLAGGALRGRRFTNKMETLKILENGATTPITTGNSAGDQDKNGVNPIEAEQQQQQQQKYQQISNFVNLTKAALSALFLYLLKIYLSTNVIAK